MLEETQDEQEIIARVAALDIGKAELVCCVRVPGPKGGSRRVQEVATYSAMTRSLQVPAPMCSRQPLETPEPVRVELAGTCPSPRTDVGST